VGLVLRLLLALLSHANPKSGVNRMESRGILPRCYTKTNLEFLRASTPAYQFLSFFDRLWRLTIALTYDKAKDKHTNKKCVILYIYKNANCIN